MAVQGIDVSGWNKPQDWSEAKKAGIEFAFVKVSQGLNGSRRSDVHHRDFGAAGILRGGYHFANFKYKGKTQPVQQCENMVRRLEKVGDWDLPPVLDAEWMTYVSGHTKEKKAANKAARIADIGVKSCKFPKEAVVDWLREFGSRCVELTGMLPILYTGKNFWKYRMGSADFSGWLLWEVDYIKPQFDPPPFKTESKFVPPWAGVDIWQWTGQTAPSWYKGRKLDRNLYNGTLTELQGVSENSRMGSFS